jgi:putative component of membrane protein insertase Oxa1/YidC/SpoIIIJ protein YidD
MNKLSLVAVSAIEYYQKYISPHKGFRCAHGALYNGPSCSAYSKAKFMNEGILIGAISTIQRLNHCREANKILRQQLQLNGLTSPVFTPKEPEIIDAEVDRVMKDKGTKKSDFFGEPDWLNTKQARCVEEGCCCGTAIVSWL